MRFKTGHRGRINTAFTVIPLFCLHLISIGAVRSQTEAVELPVDTTQLAEPVGRVVSFADDVFPILKQKCLDCHEGANPESGVHLDHYAKMVGQSDGIPLVIPGKSEQSRLIHVVSGLDIERQMPPVDTGEPLSDEGAAFVEIGKGQEAAIVQLATNANLELVKSHRDLSDVIRCLQFGIKM